MIEPRLVATSLSPRRRSKMVGAGAALCFFIVQSNVHLPESGAPIGLLAGDGCIWIANGVCRATNSF